MGDLVIQENSQLSRYLKEVGVKHETVRVQHRRRSTVDGQIWHRHLPSASVLWGFLAEWLGRARFEAWLDTVRAEWRVLSDHVLVPPTHARADARALRLAVRPRVLGCVDRSVSITSARNTIAVTVAVYAVAAAAVAVAFAVMVLVWPTLAIWIGIVTVVGLIAVVCATAALWIASTYWQRLGAAALHTLQQWSVLEREVDRALRTLLEVELIARGFRLPAPVLHLDSTRVPALRRALGALLGCGEAPLHELRAAALAARRRRASWTAQSPRHWPPAPSAAHIHAALAAALELQPGAGGDPLRAVRPLYEQVRAVEARLLLLADTLATAAAAPEAADRAQAVLQQAALVQEGLTAALALAGQLQRELAPRADAGGAGLAAPASTSSASQPTESAAAADAAGPVDGAVDASAAAAAAAAASMGTAAIEEVLEAMAGSDGAASGGSESASEAASDSSASSGSGRLVPKARRRRQRSSRPRAAATMPLWRQMKTAGRSPREQLADELRAVLQARQSTRPAPR